MWTWQSVSERGRVLCKPLGLPRLVHPSPLHPSRQCPPPPPFARSARCYTALLRPFQIGPRGSSPGQAPLISLGRFLDTLGSRGVVLRTLLRSIVFGFTSMYVYMRHISQPFLCCAVLPLCLVGYFFVATILESFIQAQKMSVRRALRRGFRKYLADPSDFFALLLVELQKMVR